MKTSKRLSVAVIVGCIALLGGALLGTAEAKKKKKKSATVTVSRATPTTIPVRTGDVNSIATVPLTIGKKAKGKVVSPEGPTVTYQLLGAAGELFKLNIRLTAPNGRTTVISNPAGVLDTAVGPITYTANSAIGTCSATLAPPPPPCENPEDTLLAPYIGTARDSSLDTFNGLSAKGTWTVKVTNSSTTQAATLANVKVTVPTVSKPQ